MWVIGAGAALIVTIGVLFATGVFGGRAKIEDPLFFYVNLEQLAKKGALDKHITADNRRMIASIASVEMDNTHDADLIKNIITDFNTTGIDFTAPIYGYLHNSTHGMVIVAEVEDIDLVDQTMKLISDNTGDSFSSSIQDDVRTVVTDEDEVLICYDDTRFAIIIGDEEYVDIIAKDAMERKMADLSIFGDADMALYSDLDKAIAIADQYINDELAEYEEEYNDGWLDEWEYEYYTENTRALKSIIDMYRGYIDDEASLTISTTFEKGRVVLAYDAEGINFDEWEDMYEDANLDHLEYFNKDVIAVAGTGINGEEFAKKIREFIDGDMMTTSGYELDSEDKMAASIACDAIATIDGGATIGLDKLNGYLHERYSYYWDEYTYEPRFESANALFMMDVDGEYIISNVGQFAGQYMNKEGHNKYTTEFEDMDVTLAQVDNLLYAGLNMQLQERSNSAENAIWYDDVKGSLAYFVINIDALMKSSLIKAFNDEIIDEIGDDLENTYNRFTEMFSYVYMTCDSFDHSEFVIVFDDKDTNALEQVTNIVLPVVMSEVMSELY